MQPLPDLDRNDKTKNNSEKIKNGKLLSRYIVGQGNYIINVAFIIHIIFVTVTFIPFQCTIRFQRLIKIEFANRMTALSLQRN